MIIRLASEADLEAMTAVLIGASPLDPVYPYRFPDRHLYPDEFAALCRRKCAEYLESSTVVVCEMPTSHRHGAPTQVVAFSAWDMPSSTANPSNAHSHSRRNSAVEPTSPTTATFPTTIGHLTRQAAFRAALSSQKTRLFDARFRPHGGHVFLKILLTHPAYQRRGAGTALAQWGVEQARVLGVCTTVFASPMGLELYRKLGFREVGRFRVQCEGEGEFLEIPALVRGRGEVRLKGLIDWAEGEWLPFGIGLYGLEELLGRTVEGANGRKKFEYYPDADRLRAIFWEELGKGAPELVHNPVIRARVEKARLFGLLLWHGIAFDDGRLNRVVEPGRDDEELQKLDLFLFGPNGPAMSYAEALEAAAVQTQAG